MVLKKKTTKHFCTAGNSNHVKKKKMAPKHVCIRENGATDCKLKEGQNRPFMFELTLLHAQSDGSVILGTKI
jgi:hypothetical protein